MLELNKIYNMDCLEGMKLMDDQSVDMIVTSPPYNKHMKNGGVTVVSIVYDEYEDDMDETAYQEWQIRIINECHRVLKDGGSMFYNHKNRYIDGDLVSPLEWLRKTDFKIRQEIIWDKRIAANLRGWRFWNVDERIYWLQKGKPVELKMDVATMSSIWRIFPQKKKEFNHPCGFPVELVMNCISVLDGKGKTVMDPFMGSGTTAIASLMRGHNYIGFEVSKTYCDIAEKRLKNEKQKLYLF